MCTKGFTIYHHKELTHLMIFYSLALNELSRPFLLTIQNSPKRKSIEMLSLSITNNSTVFTIKKKKLFLKSLDLI